MKRAWVNEFGGTRVEDGVTYRIDKRAEYVDIDTARRLRDALDAAYFYQSNEVGRDPGVDLLLEETKELAE